MLLFLGPDPEAWLENGGHHSRATQGDQDHEHGGIRTHHDMAAESYQPVGADAGGTSLSYQSSTGFLDILYGLKALWNSDWSVIYNMVPCCATQTAY